ncbi:magnesium/cobalt transporter CorA [Chloroflexota bacterium]
MPFKAYYLSPANELRVGLDENEIRQVFGTKQGLLWVDVNETTEKDGSFLEQTFKFHPLAVEDCVSSLIHSPKVDDFVEYIFIVIHGINHTVESEIVETAELSIFLGPHFVVSNHNTPLYSVEAIRQQVEKDGRPMKRGADFLTHALADALVDNVLPTIDNMSDVAEDIEEETIRNPRQTTLEAILRLKRSTLRVHRVMAPQREIFNRLSRGDFRVIKDEAKIFYRDVYDHLVRIEELNQTIRDRVDNALATYLSSVANRQNEVMKTLAIVATIFMPLTLLAGIYGMNFENMPELKWEWGYFAVLGVIWTAIVGLLWRFWSRGWIAWGRSHVTRVRSLTVRPEKLVGFISHATKKPFR